MNKNTSWQDYQDRLRRVIAYIYDHLDDELDLNRLADVACMSPYHWHRVYQALCGETIAATVKRLRLHRAAGYLAQTSMAVRDIAKRTGYANLQSFTRIFNSVYGLPPAQYRKRGSHTQFKTPLKGRARDMYDISIKEIPKMKAITIQHEGSYMHIGKAFDVLYGWLGAHNLIGPDTRSVGIYYDDPGSVPEDKLRSRAGVILSREVTIEPPLEYAEIRGGRYAVLTHKGPYANMRGAYEWLYGEWLPKSGQDAADAPIFEEYLNNPRDTQPTELLSEICLPLT